ncbi:MAG: site-2 protease family protein [Planctomycetales bacterium]|nr:site-2 protease family protein [Planctomycetales bacterium]
MDTHLILGLFDIGGLLQTLGNFGKVALGIGFVIFVHELGHFLAAKACGVKCEKFYVGFDPPLRFLPSALFKFQWGETEYGLGIIPLGGYVKMLGQDDNPARAAEEAERTKVVTTTPDGKERVELDPRSYVAKSVPQRMLIISAGVIMNLISAVFIAGFAYGFGVNITPVEIAGTSPGDPAWVHNMRPGDKVVQIGDRGEPDEHLRWRWEFQQEVMKSGISDGDPVTPLKLKIRTEQGEERWEQIKPTDRQRKTRQTVTLGVMAIQSNRLLQPARFAHMTAAKAEPALEPEDRVIAVNGQPLKGTANDLGDLPGTDINDALVHHVDQPITLTIERTREEGTTTFDSVIAPNPLQSVGVVMEIGPVVGIRLGSPAESAGFREGDIITSIQGQPVGDPITLPFRLPRDETLEIVVRRDDQEQTLQVAQDFSRWNVAYDGRGARCGLETIGLAYAITNRVAEVLPDTAAAESIKPGDVVIRFQQLASGDDHKAALERLGPNYNSIIELDDEEVTWKYVNGLIQEAGAGIRFRLTILRDKKESEVELTAAPLANEYFPDRGLTLAPLTRMHIAESWGEAFQLGVRETGEKVGEVWSVLTMLFTGKVPLRNLGGPVLIATVAGAEANEGLSRLLLFLTYLSANLAILNFLPIPVLDGGHMVFLMWEGAVGKPMNEQVQQWATFGAFCLLMALMVFVFTNDLQRLFGS